ncbi:MAG: hypothetical protein Q8M03_12365 [Legionella sp.]|nr:hypothetical protein [Legionella sp.]
MEVNISIRKAQLEISKSTAAAAPFYKDTSGLADCFKSKEKDLCYNIPVLDNEPEVQQLASEIAPRQHLLEVKFCKAGMWPEAFLLCNGYYVETGMPDSSALYYSKFCSHVFYIPLLILILVFVILGTLLLNIIFLCFIIVFLVVYRFCLVPTFDTNKVYHYNVQIDTFLSKNDETVTAIDMSHADSYSTDNHTPQINMYEV